MTHPDRPDAPTPRTHHPAPTTVDRRFGAGPAVRRGTQAGLPRARGRRRRAAHRARPSSLGAAGPDARTPDPARRRPLLVLRPPHRPAAGRRPVAGPVRVLQPGVRRPSVRELVPVQRPQEALTAHAVDAMIRTLNAAGRRPGRRRPAGARRDHRRRDRQRPVERAAGFLALLRGRPVRPGSGRTGVRGRAGSWAGPTTSSGSRTASGRPGPTCSGPGSASPTTPACSTRAMAPFAAAGLRCRGWRATATTRLLIQGVGSSRPGSPPRWSAARKPSRLPPGFDADQRRWRSSRASPRTFMAGDAVAVTADPDRRPVSRREFVDAHFRAGASPPGTGSPSANRRDGTAYYVHDLPGVRFIALDTACRGRRRRRLAGRGPGAAGWTERLDRGALGRSAAPTDQPCSTGNQDRLVVAASPTTGWTRSTNARATRPRTGAPPAAGPGVLRTAAPVPQRGAVDERAHARQRGDAAHRPDDPGRGFWEVTTCSVVDWPCQARVIELIDDGDGSSRSRARCSTTTARPAPARRRPRACPGRTWPRCTASWPANVPWAGFDSPRPGQPSDRNVELRVAAPFVLPRG